MNSAKNSVGLLSFDYEIDRKQFFDLGDDGVTEDAYNKAAEYYERKRRALAEPFLASMKKVQESKCREQGPERAFIDFS